MALNHNPVRIFVYLENSHHVDPKSPQRDLNSPKLFYDKGVGVVATLHAVLPRDSH